MVKHKLEATVPKEDKRTALFVLKAFICDTTMFAWRKFATVNMAWLQGVAVALPYMDLAATLATQVTISRVIVAFRINAFAPMAMHPTEQAAVMTAQCRALLAMPDSPCLTGCASKDNAAVPMASHKWVQDVLTVDMRIAPFVLKVTT